MIVTDEEREKLERAAMVIYEAYHAYYKSSDAIKDAHAKTDVDKRTLLAMWYTVHYFVSQFG